MSMLNNFAFYLKNMTSWLNENQNFGCDQVSIILDNCSIHRAGKTMEYLHSRSWNIYFLPPYSPQLVPVELAFNHIKAHIEHRSRDTGLKLNTTRGLGYSLEIMKPIEAKSVKGYYSKYFETLKGFLPIFK